MIDDLVAGYVVAGNCVAVATACRKRNVARERPLLRLREIPAREQIAAIRRAGTHAMRTAPQLVLPVDDSAIGHRTLCLHHHGRPVRLPCKLIVAHPLHAHRPAGNGAREQRSVERHVVVAVAAIASCALGEDAPDGHGFDLQGFGEVLPEREYALRMRPDGEFSIPEFGKRAGRTDRGMGEVRLPIGRLHEVGPAGAHASLLLTGDRVDRPQ